MPQILSRTVVASIILMTLAAVPRLAFAVPATRSAAPTTQAMPLTAGDYRREVTAAGRLRSYLVHVPRKYDPKKPTPVVLAFHGAFMNGTMMVYFCGLNSKSDDAGFIVVYPNGVGAGTDDKALFFNASATAAAGGPVDDVAFTAKLLDDLAGVATVDPQRVFATGMSNGGMMCHRLAAEMSDRIAAIAPVAGTLAIAKIHPKRPVPVIHFHGTADGIVPLNGPTGLTPRTMTFRSVEETVKAWVAADGCPETAKITEYPAKTDDGVTAKRIAYGPGTDGAEVILIEVKGGGHTWPGRDPAFGFLGKSTKDVAANDLMWEFFLKHPMK